MDTGIPTPSAAPYSAGPVPFNVMVEPLYFGVLPASTAPTVIFILAIVLATSILVPTVISWANVVALDLRKKHKMD